MHLFWTCDMSILAVLLGICRRGSKHFEVTPSTPYYLLGSFGLCMPCSSWVPCWLMIRRRPSLQREQLGGKDAAHTYNSRLHVQWPASTSLAHSSVPACQAGSLAAGLHGCVSTPLLGRQPHSAVCFGEGVCEWTERPLEMSRSPCTGANLRRAASCRRACCHAGLVVTLGVDWLNLHSAFV